MKRQRQNTFDNYQEKYVRISIFSVSDSISGRKISLENSGIFLTDELRDIGKKGSLNVWFTRPVEDRTKLLYLAMSERHNEFINEYKNHQERFSGSNFFWPIRNIEDPEKLVEKLATSDNHLLIEVLATTISRGNYLIISHDIIKSPYLAVCECIEERRIFPDENNIFFEFSIYESSQMKREKVMNEALNKNYEEVSVDDIRKMIRQNTRKRKAVAKKIRKYIEKIITNLEKYKDCDDFVSILYIHYLIEDYVSEQLSKKMRELLKTEFLLIESEEMLRTALRLKEKEEKETDT